MSVAAYGADEMLWISDKREEQNCLTNSTSHGKHPNGGIFKSLEASVTLSMHRSMNGSVKFLMIHAGERVLFKRRQDLCFYVLGKKNNSVPPRFMVSKLLCSPLWGYLWLCFLVIQNLMSGSRSESWLHLCCSLTLFISFHLITKMFVYMNAVWLAVLVI